MSSSYSDAPAIPVYLAGHRSVGNGTTTPLGGGETFTGIEERTRHPDILVTLKSDVAGTLYIDVGIVPGTYDTVLSFDVAAGAGEFHTAVKAARYCRVRYVNGSAAQSYFRMQTEFGHFRQANSPLGTPIQQDADAATVRAITEEVAIAEGLFGGYSIVNKFGTNSDIDTGSTPEDIWEGGGAYTGWATAGEPLRAVSTSTNDANGGSGAEKVRVQAMTTDYEWVSVTFTLNGTTPVAPDAPYASTSFIRCHTGTVTQSASGANTAQNAGDITIYQATTTANIFLKMLAGRNQSNAAVYTIPAGYTAYMRSLHSAIRGGATASVDGAIWTRVFGGTWRTRRPWQIASIEKSGPGRMSAETCPSM